MARDLTAEEIDALGPDAVFRWYHGGAIALDDAERGLLARMRGVAVEAARVPLPPPVDVLGETIAGTVADLSSGTNKLLTLAVVGLLLVVLLRR